MAANRVTLRPAAEADLLDIYEYIACAAGPIVANAYIERLTDQCASLLHFSARGKARDDPALGLRTMTFEGRAVIAYRIEPDRVRIVRVIHAGRNITDDLFDQ